MIVLIAAFAAIYLIWGSTYLAIKYAIETLPPFLMAGFRFIVAGFIILVWARLSGTLERPTRAHWKTSFIVGTLLLLGGNGGVVFAQKYIPSSLAALLVATEPFWIVLLSWLWLGKVRPNLKVVSGLALGLFGIWLLVSGNHSSNAVGDNSMQIWAAIAIIVATLSWAFGSLYGLRAPVPKSALQASGMQMLVGGTVMLLVGILKGEAATFNFANVSLHSWFGLAYLIIFGSIIGFTAYSWLLKNAQPAMVSTYAYVNPVVAVFLGWLIAGESFTTQMLVGAGIIIGSVVLITSQENDKGKKSEECKDLPNDCEAVSV